jgi:O-methyltransferase domain
MRPPPFPLPKSVTRSVTEARRHLQNLADAVLPPAAGLLDLAWGIQRTMIAGTLITSGLADAIGSEARSPANLAGELGLDPDVTTRLVEAAVASRLLRLDRSGRAHLTNLGAPMCSDHPQSIASWVAFMADPDTAAAYAHLGTQLREGAHPSGWQRTFGKSVWDSFEEHPAAARRFDDSMRELTAAFDLGVTRAYSWPRHGVICDVGGGTGQLLAEILKRRRRARGILLETENVIEEAQEYLRERGLADRVECRVGSFFQSLDVRADVYTMKWIMHDWNDDACREILTRLRATMPSGSRVVTIDLRRDPGRPNFVNSMLDLGVLVVWEGRERSPDEVHALMRDAGLKAGQVRHAGPTMLVEGIAP